MAFEFTHVLLVEDDADYANLLRLRLSLVDSTRFYPAATMSRPIKLTHVVMFRQARELLNERTFNLILLDLALPDSDELDSLALLTEEHPSTPVVVITGLYDEELASQALQMGAQDYLLKEKISGEILDRAIRYAIERRRLLNELEEQYATELEVNEQSLRNLIVHMADGIVVVDSDGIVQFANPAFLSLMECSSQDVIGEKSPLLLKQDETTEFQRLHRNGTTHIYEIRTVPIHWEGAAANLASVRDVTLQRRTTAALQQYASELEKHNESLDAFSHIVAHNLRHPLSHLLLIVNSLCELSPAELSPEMIQYLRSIEEFGDKMSYLIDELLLFSQTRSKDDVLTTPIAMADVIDQVLKRLDYTIAQRGAQIVVPADWPSVWGYAPWVEEIWMNYLDNAIKYGGSPPRIEVGYESQQDQMVRFWVRDNGPGIAFEEQRHLFEPFRQFGPKDHGSNMRRGAGLGLSIVRQIVEKLGGDVAFHSVEETQLREGTETGSVFSFTLPSCHK